MKHGKGLLVIGMSLALIGIGSMFSLELVKYSYYILIATFLLVVFTAENAVKENVSKQTLAFSLSAAALTSFFFGMQAPGIFGNIFLYTGAGLAIIGGVLLWKKQV